MSATPWNTRLDEATTERGVITVCDGFITSCSFEDLGKIPARCQPKHVMEPADVGPYALKLAERVGEGDTAPTLQRMSAFFSQAALRLEQLALARPDLGTAADLPLVAFPYR